MPIATNDQGSVVFLDKTGSWTPAKTAVNPETKSMMALDGDQWVPVPATSKGVMGHVDDAVRSIANGITFGWADEIAAKMNEFVGSGDYQSNLASERARDAQIPVTIQLPGEIAGAVGATVLTAPLGAIRGLAAASARFPAWMKFGALGAAEGAVAGAGGAEGDRMSGAATGAALGAGIGAVAPSVTNAVATVARDLRGAVQPSAMARADIARAVARDEMTPAQLADNFIAASAQRPGVATIADAGGENVKGLVERVAQTPGAGRTIAIPALTTRQEEQLSRLTTDLKELTGTTKTARKAIDDTIAERAAASQPLYDAAFNFNARANDEVVRVWDNVTSTGYGKAIVNSSDFRRTLQTVYGIRDAADAPLMVQIDAFKKLADDAVGSAVRSGNGQRASVIGNMRDDVLRVVDRANPAYREARMAWAGPSKFMDAIEEGRGILSTKIDADELHARLAKMSDAEKEGVRIGAISAIQARMGSNTATLPDLTKYLRSPEMREKIAAIMPSPEAAQAWNARLNFETESSKTAIRAVANSATARRVAEMNDAKTILGDLAFDALVSGPSTMMFLRTMATSGPKAIRDTIRSRTDREVADLLLNPARANELPNIIRAAAKARTGAAAADKTKAAVTGAGVSAVE